jgi:hypothetical protein
LLYDVPFAHQGDGDPTYVTQSTASVGGVAAAPLYHVVAESSIGEGSAFSAGDAAQRQRIGVVHPLVGAETAEYDGSVEQLASSPDYETVAIAPLDASASASASSTGGLSSGLCGSEGASNTEALYGGFDGFGDDVDL